MCIVLVSDRSSDVSNVASFGECLLHSIWIDVTIIMVITSFEIDFVVDVTNQREKTCSQTLTCHKVHNRILRFTLLLRIPHCIPIYCSRMGNGCMVVLGRRRERWFSPTVPVPIVYNIPTENHIHIIYTERKISVELLFVNTKKQKFSYLYSGANY